MFREIERKFSQNFYVGEVNGSNYKVYISKYRAWQDNIHISVVNINGKIIISIDSGLSENQTNLDLISSYKNEFIELGCFFDRLGPGFKLWEVDSIEELNELIQFDMIVDIYEKIGG